MKIDRNKALTMFGLTLLMTSLLFVNTVQRVSAQEPDIYLHGPSLVPIHMHGPSLAPIHMHSKIGIIDLSDPMWTPWHELHPEYCQNWTFTSWEDNTNGYLDSSDQIDMTNDDTGGTRWYHVDRVTMTMRLYSEYYDETIYVEFKGPYDPDIIDPVCTNWTEIWPVYLGVTGGPYHICVWQDNGNGYLDVCDYIGFDQFPEVWWHVEEYSTDLILNEKIMDPIGIRWHELYPSYCNWHELTSWKDALEDPYPGRLSPGDQIDMINETSGITKWYFVDRVTLTLYITLESTGEAYYFEFKGSFEEMYDVKTEPVCTYWHMVWPYYEYLAPGDPGYHITDWIDNCNGVLDYCDYILLEGEWCHVEEVCIDIILNEKIDDPTCTFWHELYPECCINDYHILDWSDNGDRLLSPCDNITMQLMPAGTTDEYHVEEVTLTLNLTVEDSMGSPFEIGQRIYIESVYGYTWMYYVKIDPEWSEWEVVCPTEWFGYPLVITWWGDTCNGVLSYCDYIELMDPYEGLLWCHVDDVAVDMTVKKIVEPVHDVAVISVSPYFTQVHQGWPCPITVTVENQGDFTETFDVDVKYDGSHVTTSPTTVYNLAPGNTRALTFCWVTKGVPLSTYTISAYAHPVPDETDLADNTLVDGTVQIIAQAPPGFYWKEGFCDYAPSGMPDFDQRQDAWDNQPGSQYWTWCSPTAVGNSLWWFDSKYEPHQPPILPPTIEDGFPLVSSYIPGIDDHDPANVQPFIQHLAYLMDTDGQRTFVAHAGTYVSDMQTGLTHYLSWTGVNPLGDVNGDGVVDLADVTIVDDAMGTIPGAVGWDMRADIHPVTLGWPGWGPADNVIDPGDLALVTANLGAKGMFYEQTVNQPDFYLIAEEVGRSQDVVLSIGFWYWDGEFWVYREELGHSVTVAGVNLPARKIAISDPMYDAFENGLIPEGRVPIPHVHLPPEPPYITHNDAALVSHDIYNVMQWSPPFPPCPGGNEILVNYAGWCGFEGEPGMYAVIEDAVITCPREVPDIAVTNLTICFGQIACAQNITHHINVTVTNEGPTDETFTLTVHWNDTNVIGSKPVSLLSGDTKIVAFTWNASQARYMDYILSAYATPVPGEIDIADNKFTDGTVIIVMSGDVDADKDVDIYDVVLLCGCYGSKVGDPSYNPNCDIDCDGDVDIYDVVLLCGNYGYVEP